MQRSRDVFPRATQPSPGRKGAAEPDPIAEKIQGRLDELGAAEVNPEDAVEQGLLAILETTDAYGDAPQCVQPSSGMVSWWDGDNNTVDLVSGTSGALIGGTYAAGMVGQGFSFDGVDDYVDLPDGFADFTSGFTVALWANPTPSGKWARFIDLGNGRMNDNILFARRSTTNDLALEVFDGISSPGAAVAAKEKITNKDAITNNEWHHYAATLDATGKAKMYRDGLPLVMATDTTGVPNNVQGDHFMKRIVPLFVSAIVLAACGGDSAQSPAPSAAEPAAVAGADLAVPAEPPAGEKPAGQRPSLSEIQAQIGAKTLSEPWVGDLDGMIERRVIRVLTVYGIGRYFYDGPQEKGITYELMKMFEDAVNEHAGTGHLRVHVVFIPVARDELIQGLLDGRGDIAAAGLTITEERKQRVDFSEPSTKPLSEILVTGPSAPPIASIDGLAGQTVRVRSSSSYRDAMVNSVEKDGPAAKAGLEPGDVILRFDGRAIERSSDLPRIVGGTKPGTSSTLSVFRKGAPRDLKVQVAEMPQDRPRSARTTETPKPAAPANALGLGVSDVSAEKMKELGIKGGVQVDAVDGLAASAGLRPGDIITQMNSTDVQNARQFNEAVAKLDPKKDVAVLVRRGEASRYVIIRR